MAVRIYTTTVTNDGGTAGQVRVSDGPELLTGPPSNPQQGVNPEQFLGMAWSTCLNATVEAVLKDRAATLATSGPDGGATVPRSRVVVQVSLEQEPSGQYRFIPKAQIAVEGLDEAALREVTAAAHARCPVSKLLAGGADPVSVTPAPWDALADPAETDPAEATR